MALKDFLDPKDVGAIVAAGVLYFISKWEAAKEKRQEKEEKLREKEEEKAAKEAEKERLKQELPATQRMNVKLITQIDNLLLEIRCTIGCDRVSMFEISEMMDKISCILESKDEENNTKALLGKFTDMPIATMLKTLNEIEDSEYGWKHFDDNSTDEAANKRRHEMGIKTSYNFKISDSIWTDGMIGMHWMHGYAMLTEMEVEEAKKLVQKIKTLKSLLVKIKKWDTEQE